MAGGMVGTGTGYERNALSGFSRLSELESQREATNKQLKEQETQQMVSMGTSLGTLAILGAVLL